MTDIIGRADGPIRGSVRESSEWAKLLEETPSTDAQQPAARTTVQPTIQPAPTASASPLVRAAAAYEEAKTAHIVAQASLIKAQREEEETRAEEERAHNALLAEVAQIAPKEKSL